MWVVTVVTLSITLGDQCILAHRRVFQFVNRCTWAAWVLSDSLRNVKLNPGVSFWTRL